MPFVPSDLDPSNIEHVESLYRALLERPIESAVELERWLQDASDLESQVDELGSRKYIAHTCHTDDEVIERDYLHFVESVEPRLKPLAFELQKRLVTSPHLRGLDMQRYGMLERSWRNAVELYREENIALETNQSKLVTSYGKITAAMMVDFQGQRRTLQQMAKILEEPDRALRKEAWELTTQRREQDKAQIDEIFTELLSIRQQIARNAGYSSYRDYAFRRRERFDYTAEDCLRFGDSIAELCLPALEGFDRERRQALGVEHLRPWDLAVDPYGSAPLRPFEEDQIGRFIEKIRDVFAKISPSLSQLFSQLRPGENLDLESREGKRPGGYQASLEVSKQPFIFMNAVGSQRDVETLLHEGGHAFHYLDASAEPLVFLRHAPIEFCEVASMSMEILGSGALDVFYPPRDVARAVRNMFEGIVRFLPWMATIDGFQHWLYTNPGHSPEERREAWLKTLRRFSSTVVDWSGYEESLAWRWQPQLHIFGMPFYYIEYGIAQLGALQMWQNFRRDDVSALQKLREAFVLGGTRPLPELFTTAGLRFDFSSKTLGPLLAAVQQHLGDLTSELTSSRHESC